MNKLAINRSVIAGVIGGAILSVFSFGTYYTSINSFAGFTFIYTWLPVMIVVLLIMGFNLRKQQGGFASFKEILQFAMVAYLIYEIIVALTTYILYFVIDPQLTKKLLDTVAQFSATMMKSVGAQQADIDKMMASTRKQQVSTGSKNVLLGLGTSLIWDFIKSLLIAVIVKKERPADFDYTPQTTL